MNETNNLLADWQTWAVALVLVLCLARLIYGMRTFFVRSQRGECTCGCSSCPSARSEEKRKASQETPCCCTNQKKSAG